MFLVACSGITATAIHQGVIAVTVSQVQNLVFAVIAVFAVNHFRDHCFPDLMIKFRFRAMSR